jgi:hypothetical protein
MAINIARRKFIAALSGAAVLWPFVARAQPYLDPSTPACLAVPDAGNPHKRGL